MGSASEHAHESSARSILWGHRDKQGWPLTSDTQIKQQRAVIHAPR